MKQMMIIGFILLGIGQNNLLLNIMPLLGESARAAGRKVGEFGAMKDAVSIEVILTPEAGTEKANARANQIMKY